LRGQINGTTGYEEAARKGWSPGCRRSGGAGRAPPQLDRANSYIAVMIDDLTLQGVSEPYRMLTARAEYRLRLRANNAATSADPAGHRSRLHRRGARKWFERREAAREQWGAALQREVPAAELAASGCLFAATAAASRWRFPAESSSSRVGRSGPWSRSGPRPRAELAASW
jgi:tRNA uridine 5-carboxymethylaminomethyl modification enzyme